MQYISEKDLKDGEKICKEHIKTHMEFANSRVLPKGTRAADAELAKLWEEQLEEIKAVKNLKLDPNDPFSELKNNMKRNEALKGVNSMNNIGFNCPGNVICMKGRRL